MMVDFCGFMESLTFYEKCVIMESWGDFEVYCDEAVGIYESGKMW